MDPSGPGRWQGPAARAARSLQRAPRARPSVAPVRHRARYEHRHAPDGVPLLLLLPRGGRGEHPAVRRHPGRADRGDQRRALADPAFARPRGRPGGCGGGVDPGDGDARRDVLRAGARRVTRRARDTGGRRRAPRGRRVRGGRDRGDDRGDPAAEGAADRERPEPRRDPRPPGRRRRRGHLHDGRARRPPAGPGTDPPGGTVVARAGEAVRAADGASRRRGLLRPGARGTAGPSAGRLLPARALDPGRLPGGAHRVPVARLSATFGSASLRRPSDYAFAAFAMMDRPWNTAPSAMTSAVQVTSPCNRAAGPSSTFCSATTLPSTAPWTDTLLARTSPLTWLWAGSSTEPGAIRLPFTRPARLMLPALMSASTSLSGATVTWPSTEISPLMRPAIQRDPVVTRLPSTWAPRPTTETSRSSRSLMPGIYGIAEQ